MTWETAKLRELRRDDDKEIDSIVMRLSQLWGISPQEVRKAYIEASFNGSFPYIFIAQDTEAQLLGYTFLIFEEEGYLHINKQPWLTALFVLEKFRGHGVARKLINTAEEKCRDLGYNTLYLDTASAADYYRKIGEWIEIGKEFWKEGKKEVIIMKKNIL